MPRQKSNAQRYRERVERAKAYGFKSYPEERKARATIKRDIRTAVEKGIIDLNSIPSSTSNEFRLLLLAKGQIKGPFDKGGKTQMTKDMVDALKFTFAPNWTDDERAILYSILRGMYG